MLKYKVFVKPLHGRYYGKLNLNDNYAINCNTEEEHLIRLKAVLVAEANLTFQKGNSIFPEPKPLSQTIKQLAHQQGFIITTIELTHVESLKIYLNNAIVREKIDKHRLALFLGMSDRDLSGVLSMVSKTSIKVLINALSISKSSKIKTLLNKYDNGKLKTNSRSKRGITQSVDSPSKDPRVSGIE